MKKKSNNIELNRWIANYTSHSRRKATQLIKDRKVSVNNTTVDKPYQKVNPLKDKIKVSGKLISNSHTAQQLVYYLINKPSGFVSSTRSDSSGNPPATTLIREKSRIYPVGRLDIDSQGLLILTNDGDLTYKLTHPKSNIEKEYQVFVRGKVTNQKIDILQQGIQLKEGKTRPIDIRVDKIEKSGAWLTIVLREGKNRQIRRSCAMQDLHVSSLTRVRIGSLSLGRLKPGEYRALSNNEVMLLME